ncbi:MAG: hypothetical protein WAK31_31200 [Chthoniobacterales bacterium]
MDIVLTWILPIAVFCIVLDLFYSIAARPTLRDSVRFKLFSLRDKLRMMAIDGQVSPKSEDYRYLEHELCCLIDRCYWFSWAPFLEFLFYKKGANQRDDSIRFDKNASDELKEIKKEAVLEIRRAIFVNSPWVTSCLIISILVFIFGWQVNRWLVSKIRGFIDEAFNDPSVIPC